MTCAVDTLEPTFDVTNWIGLLDSQAALTGIKKAIVNREARRTVAEYASVISNELDTPLNEKLRKLIGAIKHMRNLLPNWDSYGAQPPSWQVIVRADNAVRQALNKKCLPDVVIPSAEGGVALCWDIADRHAYIEFGNDGSAIRAEYRTRQAPDLAEFSAIDEDALDAQFDRILGFLS